MPAGKLGFEKRASTRVLRVGTKTHGFKRFQLLPKHRKMPWRHKDFPAWLMTGIREAWIEPGLDSEEGTLVVSVLTLPGNRTLFAYEGDHITHTGGFHYGVERASQSKEPP